MVLGLLYTFALVPPACPELEYKFTVTRDRNKQYHMYQYTHGYTGMTQERGELKVGQTCKQFQSYKQTSQHSRRETTKPSCVETAEESCGQTSEQLCGQLLRSRVDRLQISRVDKLLSSPLYNPAIYLIDSLAGNPTLFVIICFQLLHIIFGI